MTGPRGYPRRRRGTDMLEAVIKLGGRTITRSTGYRVGQENEAQRFVDVLVAELGGAAPEPGGLTVRAWGTQWIAERKARGVLSADNEEALLRYHVFPELGDAAIAALTKARMLEWVRGLPQHPRHGSEETISPRTVHHVAGTTRRLFAEAVDRELLTSSPCAWRAKRDLPAKLDRQAGKRNRSGFAGTEVWQLTHDERIPLDRRVLWAFDFLTGMRPGEVAVRRWRDLDTTAAPLWRLDVGTAYNSRHYLEKTTKTNVEKIVPVHPILQQLLTEWHGTTDAPGGWEAFMGRAPTPDDLIVPREQGGPRTNTHSNKRFQADVARLGLREGRTHYETRATFKSLAMAGGAPKADVELITHPSPREAADLYTRLELMWPALCRAVLAVRVAPPVTGAEDRPTGEVARGVAAPDAETEKARRLSAFGPGSGMGAAGFEPATPAV